MNEIQPFTYEADPPPHAMATDPHEAGIASAPAPTEIADVREQKLQLVTEMIESGTADPGYHRACKHEDTARAQAECALRRYEFQKRKEAAAQPSSVARLTDVRPAPQINHREAKRARQKARKQEAAQTA